MSFALKRMVHMAFVMWAIATILFLMFRLLPGDPTLAYIDPRVGMVLLAIFAFGLQWFPSGGASAPGASFPTLAARLGSVDFLRHLALPALTLAIYLQGLPVLLMRSNMMEVMGEEFVTMARMKGLPERTIMLRHAARNALLPLVTAFALGFGASIGGDVLVETVFS